MEAKQMIRVLEKQLNDMRKQALALVTSIDQVKAAVVAELTEAADSVSTPTHAEVFSPEFRERLRAEFLAESHKPQVRSKNGRTWPLEVKRRIVHEYKAAQSLVQRDPKKYRGAIKHVLNRHGITSAHIVQWQDAIQASVRPRAS